MGFTKKDNIYKITRVTGNRDNILGISFGNKHNTENNIEDLLCTIRKWIVFSLLNSYSDFNYALVRRQGT